MFIIVVCGKTSKDCQNQTCHFPWILLLTGLSPGFVKLVHSQSYIRANSNRGLIWHSPEHKFDVSESKFAST